MNSIKSKLRDFLQRHAMSGEELQANRAQKVRRIVAVIDAVWKPLTGFTGTCTVAGVGAISFMKQNLTPHDFAIYVDLLSTGAFVAISHLAAGLCIAIYKNFEVDAERHGDAAKIDRWAILGGVFWLAGSAGIFFGAMDLLRFTNRYL